VLAIAEGRDPDAVEEKTPDEEEAGAGEAKDSATSGKDAAAASSDKSDKSWVDDDVRERARSYGLSDADLTEFDSPDEFRKATVVLDRNLVNLARRTAETSRAAQAPAKPAEQPAIKTGEQDGLVDPQKYADAGFDSETVEAMKAIRQLQEQNKQITQQNQELSQFVTGMKASQREAERARHINEFHDAVDSMDEGRFGRSVDKDGRSLELSQPQDASRRRLYETAKALIVGSMLQAKQSGSRSEPLSLRVALQRAEQVEFGDEMRKQERLAYQEKVAEQSKRRRPSAGRSRQVAPTRAADSSEPVTSSDAVAAILGDPAVQKFIQEAHEESGA
jgi:hypothetical protein